jgi:hypothetical protein
MPDVFGTVTFAGVGTLTTARGVIVNDGGGYWAGGSTTNKSTLSDDVDKFDANTDTVSNIVDSMQNGRAEFGGTQSHHYGVWCGGWEGGNSTKIDDINFATDDVAQQSEALETGRHRNQCLTDYCCKAYIVAGRYAGFNTGDDIESLDFMTWVTTDISAALPDPRRDGAPVQTKLRGYWAGGHDDGDGQKHNEIYYLRYDTEVTGTTSATLVTARDEFAGSVQDDEHGYFAGGYFTTEVDGITFATEASYNPSGALPASHYGGSGVSGSVKGYVGGGDIGAWETDVIREMSWSSETWSTTGDALNTDRFKPATSSLPNTVSTATTHEANVTLAGVGTLDARGRLDPIVQWEGVGTLGARGALEIAGRVTMAGVGTFAPVAAQPVFKGYWCGGNPQGDDVITIDATHTIAEIENALSIGWERHIGVNAEDAGYMSGGLRNGVNTHKHIEKFVYSTETGSDLAASTTYNHVDGAGVYSDTTGYFMGGDDPSTPDYDEIDGITFSTDAYKSVTETLGSYKQYMSAVSSPTKGYVPPCLTWGGGESNNDQWDAFTFSTETNAIISQTIDDRTGSASIHTTLDGYLISGGDASSSDDLDTTPFENYLKIVYSTETISEVLDNIADVGVTRTAGTHSTVEGYVGGGYKNPVWQDDVFGFKFSTETKIDITANLPAAGGRACGLSDFLGNPPPTTSNANVHFQGIGDLDIIGTVVTDDLLGTTTMAGVGTLSTKPTHEIAGKSTLAGVGTLGAKGAIEHAGKSTLAGVGTLGADANNYVPDLMVGNARLNDPSAAAWFEVDGTGNATLEPAVSAAGWFHVDGVGNTAWLEGVVRGVGWFKADGVGSVPSVGQVQATAGVMLDPVLDGIQALRYTGLLTAAGQPDLTLQMKFFAVLKRDDQPSYYSVSCPAPQEYLNVIADYDDATFAIYTQPVFADGSSPAPYLFDFFTPEIRTSEGALSSSIQLIGYKDNETGVLSNVTIPIGKATDYSVDSDGVLTAELVPDYLQLTPATSVTFLGKTYKLDYVKLSVTTRNIQVSIRGQEV